MNYNLTEQQLKDLMHRSWLKAKKFYKGQTDEYFYDFYDAEIKQLIIGGVVGQSEQYCDWCSSPEDVEVKICKRCRKGMEQHR